MLLVEESQDNLTTHDVENTKYSNRDSVGDWGFRRICESKVEKLSEPVMPDGNGHPTQPILERKHVGIFHYGLHLGTCAHILIRNIIQSTSYDISSV